MGGHAETHGAEANEANGWFGHVSFLFEFLFPDWVLLSSFCFLCDTVVLWRLLLTK